MPPRNRTRRRPAYGFAASSQGSIPNQMYRSSRLSGAPILEHGCVDEYRRRTRRDTSGRLAGANSRPHPNPLLGQGEGEESIRERRESSLKWHGPTATNQFATCQRSAASRARFSFFSPWTRRGSSTVVPRLLFPLLVQGEGEGEVSLSNSRAVPLTFRRARLSLSKERVRERLSSKEENSQ